MIKPIFLTDLDDCLFQTEQKCPGGANLTLASIATNGRHSYMTDPQVAFIEWAIQHARVIPITARSTTAFNACQIQFQDLAVLSNGGVILNASRKHDPTWQRYIEKVLRPYQMELPVILVSGRKFAATHGIDIRSWIVEENGLRTYVVFKQEFDNSGSALVHIKNELERQYPEYQYHLNGNNLSVSPSCISKRFAAAHIIDSIREIEPRTPIIGFGDSISDYSFLSLCDWWATPSIGQISASIPFFMEWRSQEPVHLTELMDAAELAAFEST